MEDPAPLHFRVRQHVHWKVGGCGHLTCRIQPRVRAHDHVATALPSGFVQGAALEVQDLVQWISDALRKLEAPRPPALGSPTLQRLGTESPSEVRSAGDIRDVIGQALGGEGATTTVEGRERFGVTARHPRELRSDPQQMPATPK